jgi:tRNA dimethylallyltransferase
VRAVEKARQGSEHNKIADTPVIEKAVYIGLTAGRDVLYGRADKWVDSVFNDKLFNEVELIIKRFPKSHRLRGLVYKSVSDFLKGSIGLEEAVQRVKFDLHSYIRRQQTWFKRNPEIKWLDISKENFDSKIQSIVESVLNG